MSFGAKSPSDSQVHTDPTTRPSSSTGDYKTRRAMLSVDFSSPLVGAARAERIKQMTNGHKAFEASRDIQNVLCNIQTSLRRMPGVSAQESSQVITELQQVGQVISQETSQLVDAITNLELDLEDSKRANVRLSIQGKLAEAGGDDKDKQIKDLQKELAAEVEKRELAEAEVRKMMDDVSKVSNELKEHKKRHESQGGSSSPHSDTMRQKLEDTIKHLEDQVNNRRSLWVMKHADPVALARAIQSLAGSEHTQEITRKAIASLKLDSEPLEPATPRSRGSNMEGLQRSWEALGDPLNTFQPPARPGTAAPTRMMSGGGLQRPPSRMQGQPWGAAQNRSRALTYNQTVQPPPGYSRPPTRASYHSGSGRYRNAGADAMSPSYASTELVSARPGSSYHYGRDQPYQHQLMPTTPSRGNKYTRQLSSQSTPWSSTSSTQLVPHPSSGMAPTIHLTDASVHAWNEQVMDFYSIIRLFVERHASMPDYSSLVQLGRTELWPVLLATYHPLSEQEATSYLDFHLKEESSKSCLVTRVIIDYVVNRVWVPAAWVGSDRDSTMDLLHLENELQATSGQPSMIRQPLLDRQAAIIDRIMTHRDKDSDFYQHKIEEITAAIMQSIQPILNKMVSQADAYADMQVVAESAWDLSSKILTSRLTFDFRFPEIGCRFSSQSMLPIWPQMDPMELQAKHWRVALVTTPVITCRNDTGTNISAHSVALADVICMQ